MLSRLRRINSLAYLIVLDGLRRHSIIGLIIFAFAGTFGGLLFFDFIPRDIGRAVNDFLFSIIWLTGFIFLLFHAVQVMAWDHERGAMHTFLARPISRTEYSLSLFIGLAFLLFSLNLVLGCLGWWLLSFIKDSVNVSYFETLSLFFFVLSLIGLYLIELILLAMILFFSSSVRGGFPVLLLTLCYYFICSGLPVVRQAFKENDLSVENQPLARFLQFLTVLFPDFSRLDFKTFVASTDLAPALSQVAVSLSVATIYICIVLWLSCTIYERRDLQ